ncbi:MAG: hypothetical protein WAN79_07545 [Opitutaceae bacterium]
MSSTGTVSSLATKAGPAAADWLGVLMAALVGSAGGTLGASLAAGSLGVYAIAGGIFGLLGAAGLRGATKDAGTGLIWGLGGGFLVWVVLASASAAAHLAGNASQAMIGDIQARIPELMACVLCMGAPVGIALGIRGGIGPNAAPFHWGRAIAAGGAAGLASALIFSRWMYEGDFFPLIAGLGSLGSHFTSVLLHFAAACVIGCTFGALFQNDVRNLGSSMGWGMAYAIFWWILGPMTVFPAAYGQRPDWSASHASELFGPLVGYIFYGLILGVVYSGVNTVWTRLFVDSDPLNRKREGPGIHILQSVGWGSAAGFVGGLAALPLMIQTGAITKLAGLEAGTPLALGILLHLAVSTAVGASYGILFRGEAKDVVSCSLWGCMLGLIAWYAGPLTLLPLIRTGQCDWRPEAAGALLPLLVSHLLFGVITANVFSAFERSRLNRLQQIRDPFEEGLGAKPGTRPIAPLCLFVLGLGVLLPILLG